MDGGKRGASSQSIGCMFACYRADYTAGFSCRAYHDRFLCLNLLHHLFLRLIPSPPGANSGSAIRFDLDHEETAQRMLQRLDIIKLQPASWAMEGGTRGAASARGIAPALPAGARLAHARAKTVATKAAWNCFGPIWCWTKRLILASC